MGEYTLAGQAPGQRADEVDGVDLDPFTVDAGALDTGSLNALAELAAGATLAHELVGLTVDRPPLGDDVGDEATVVIRAELHRAPDRGTDVDAVRPNVAREADVEEVFQRHPPDRRTERHGQVAHRQG